MTTTEERIQKEPWAEIYSRLREEHNMVDSINELIRLKETFEAARNKENAIAFAEWVAKYCSPDFFGDGKYSGSWETRHPQLDKTKSYTTENLYDLFIEQNKKV